MEWGEPPIFPSLLLPEAPTMPAPVLEVPRAQIPSYKPLVVPPSNLRPPPGIKSEAQEEEEQEQEDCFEVRVYFHIISFENNSS